MAETSRLRELIESVGARIDFPPPDHIVALSGGADSAALAFLATRHGTLISCLHVHHGLAASDRLASAAVAIAEAVSVPLQVVEVELGKGPSQENQARDARYRALEDSAAGGVNVLLGHTRNDQAETVLMNLIRGAGPRGLAGIPPHRPPNFYRPMLDVSRSETREIASLAGLPFEDDPSNDDHDIRRNLIRMDLIPRLEMLNPALVASLARTAMQIREDNSYLDDLASMAPITSGPNGVTVSASSVAVLPRPVQVRVIRRMIGLLRQPDGVTAGESERILALFAGAASAAEIEGGIRLTREGPLVGAQIVLE